MQAFFEREKQSGACAWLRREYFYGRSIYRTKQRTAQQRSAQQPVWQPAEQRAAEGQIPSDCRAEKTYQTYPEGGTYPFDRGLHHSGSEFRQGGTVTDTDAYADAVTVADSDAESEPDADTGTHGNADTDAYAGTDTGTREADAHAG